MNGNRKERRRTGERRMARATSEATEASGDARDNWRELGLTELHFSGKRFRQSGYYHLTMLGLVQTRDIGVLRPSHAIETHESKAPTVSRVAT